LFLQKLDAILFVWVRGEEERDVRVNSLLFKQDLLFCRSFHCRTVK
jgi:hypothetical protein